MISLCLLQLFDRELCTRQLRYSGMMETAKIRQAGYPIRYTYIEFVDRFRHLAKGIPPSKKGDCRQSTQKICTAAFKEGTDYQLGDTKLFLKHHDNEYLENLRNTVLEKYVVLIQKNVRGWICRRRYQKLKKAALVVQKHFRAKGYRERYIVMRNGYKRLQATIKSRIITHDYIRMRISIIKIQARCKGFLARTSRLAQIYKIVKEKRIDENELARKNVKNFKEEALLRMHKKLAALNQSLELAKVKEHIDNSNRVDELIDSNFNFLTQTSVIEKEHFKESTVRI